MVITDIDAIWRHTTQLEDGTAGIAYQMGLLGLAPPEQFDGGAFQQYCDQGYNVWFGFFYFFIYFQNVCKLVCA